MAGKYREAGFESHDDVASYTRNGSQTYTNTNGSERGLRPSGDHHGIRHDVFGNEEDHDVTFP